MKRLTAMVLGAALTATTVFGSVVLAGAEEEAKVYKVAIDQAFAPFSILQDDGSYIGIDLDIIQAIADAEGFEVEIMPMDFSAIIPSALVSTPAKEMGTIMGG